MDTSRDDIGIAIRSAFIQKGSKQRFSLLALILISVILIFLETIEAKPLNFFRSIIKDVIYRGSAIVSQPAKIVNNSFDYIGGFFNLHENYTRLKEENDNLKNNISKSDFLELENSQLRNLIDEQMNSPSNLLSLAISFFIHSSSIFPLIKNPKIFLSKSLWLSEKEFAKSGIWQTSHNFETISSS